MSPATPQSAGLWCCTPALIACVVAAARSSLNCRLGCRVAAGSAAARAAPPGAAPSRGPTVPLCAPLLPAESPDLYEFLRLGSQLYELTSPQQRTPRASTSG